MRQTVYVTYLGQQDLPDLVDALMHSADWELLMDWCLSAVSPAAAFHCRISTTASHSINVTSVQW